MFEACECGDFEQVRRLVRRETTIDHCDYDGRTPLHVAASGGKLRIIEYLTTHGLTEINPVDRWKNTPFDDAKRGGYTNITSYL